MSHYIKILLFGFLSSLTVESHGQETTEKETILKHFILYKVTFQKKDTAIGLVYAKESYGLKKGSSGEIKASYKDGEARSDASLGTGLVVDKVKDADFYYIYIFNKHPQKADSNFLVKAGDVIRLPVSITKSNNPGLFRKIDLAGVIFTDNDDAAFINFDILWNRDD